MASTITNLQVNNNSNSSISNHTDKASTTTTTRRRRRTTVSLMALVNNCNNNNNNNNSNNSSRHKVNLNHNCRCITRPFRRHLRRRLPCPPRSVNSRPTTTTCHTTNTSNNIPIRTAAVPATAAPTAEATAAHRRYTTSYPTP